MRGCGVMAASIAVSVGGLACNGGGAVGSASINTAQTVLDLTDAVVGLQQREGEMQTQLDSLQRMVARQDTLITRLSAAAGIPVPARPFSVP